MCSGGITGQGESNVGGYLAWDVFAFSYICVILALIYGVLVFERECWVDGTFAQGEHVHISSHGVQRTFSAADTIKWSGLPAYRHGGKESCRDLPSSPVLSGST